MSKIITTKLVKAFYEGRNFKQSNSQVKSENGRISMFLHGNKIASLDIDDSLSISNCGWFSNTTKERLNGLNGVSIRQVKGEWFLNGDKWDGKTKQI